MFCPVRHQQALLDRGARQLIPPHRQAELEPELDQVLQPVGGVRTCHGPLVAEPRDVMVRQADALQQMIEHHQPPERRGQRRDQQPLIPAIHHAGDGPRGIAAETVGDQPFAPRRRIVSAELILGTSDRACHVSHLRLLFLHRRQSARARNAEGWLPHRACGRRNAGERARCRRRRIEAPRCSTARSSGSQHGGASSGSGTGLRSMSHPRLTISSRSPFGATLVSQHQHLRRDDGAVRARRGRRP